MSVDYEWDIETFNKNDDIIDHDFADKLKDHYKELVCLYPDRRLVIVRNYYPGDGSLQKSWAYVTIKPNLCLELPESFLDVDERFEAKIPQKFIKEIEQYNRRL